MRVRTEGYWDGSSTYGYRLIVLSGRCTGERFIVHDTGPNWTRQVATTALDTLCLNTGVNRNSVKFDHL